MAPCPGLWNLGLACTSGRTGKPGPAVQVEVEVRVDQGLLLEAIRNALEAGDPPPYETKSNFNAINRNKRGITLDLRSKRGRDILIQFLIEAVTLSAAGGLIGIVLGMTAAWITAHFTGWPTLTPVMWIGIACVSSAGIGIVSGFYPAWKASRLDPIEALRYE